MPQNFFIDQHFLIAILRRARLTSLLLAHACFGNDVLVDAVLKCHVFRIVAIRSLCKPITPCRKPVYKSFNSLTSRFASTIIPNIQPSNACGEIACASRLRTSVSAVSACPMATVVSCSCRYAFYVIVRCVRFVSYTLFDSSSKLDDLRQGDGGNVWIGNNLSRRCSVFPFA